MKIRKPTRFQDHVDSRSHDTMPVNWTENSRLVAIDPGLQGTGVAVWEEDTLVKAEVIRVPSSGRDWSWPRRADHIATQLMSYLPGLAYLENRKNTVVVCEYPEAFGGVKMMAWKTGDLVKLAFLVGLFSGRVAPAHFIPVPVNTWKGQLPKQVVIDRLTKRIGKLRVRQLNIQTHAWDAVGIGMWARGEF